MSLLFRIIYATHANGTHHKLALDALNHLHCPDAEAWRKFFLANAETYLEGSKAPDKQFKDFTNHVLHVRDGYWGGAAEKATNWYGHVVEALKKQDWNEAAYAAGVLSHYYTDPIMPFHTAQSEAENNIHRAAEWSINKSYNDLNKLVKSFPVPDVPIEDRDDWVADLVCDAAEISNAFYEKLIANYDFDKGVVDPVTGLNERARRMIAQLLSYAQVGQARILERAFAEAGVTPPDVELNVATVIAGLKIPVKWVVRKMSDAQDRAAVTAMYDELQATGTVEKTLSDDDRTVRETFRREVGHKSLAPRPAFRPPHAGGTFDYASALKKSAKAGESSKAAPVAREAAKPAAEKTQQETPARAAAVAPTVDVVADEAPPAETHDAQGEAAAALRDRAAEMSAADSANSDKETARPAKAADYRLHLDDEVEDGPSVGPKTAVRLNKIGIVTVSDLLNANPEEAAAGLDVSYVRPPTIVDWQDQARLQCEVPGLSGTASQLIVGAGYRVAADLADANLAELVAAVTAFGESADGDRILRDRPVPENERMERWIANALLASTEDDARSAA